MSEEDSVAGTPASLESRLQKAAMRLGYAGLIPAVVLTLWLFGIPDDHPWRATTIMLLTGYAAVILSYLGGIRWGIAVAHPDEEAPFTLFVSVLPSLFGWAALFIPPPFSFVLLAVAFAAHGAWDTLTANEGPMPDWFARLRMQLTAGVVVSMLVAFAATA